MAIFFIFKCCHGRRLAAIVNKWVERTRRLYRKQMHISGPQLTELTEVIEDTIEYFCDKEQVSGELAWTVRIECLAVAKLAELGGELAAA